MSKRQHRMERFGPTRRGGPVFRWLGGGLAIDLANTVMVVRDGEEFDLLASREDLGRWLAAERKRLGDCSFALTHLDEIRALRDAIRAVLFATARQTAPPPEALERLNAASAAAPVAMRLETDSQGRLSIDEVPAAADRVGRLLGSIAHSAITLLRGPERARLRVCDAPSCGMLFLGRRRWCSPACGNRARAARHYRRARGRGTTAARRAKRGGG
jgi:predicted RNA-binding Zn ribbon-like protein